MLPVICFGQSTQPIHNFGGSTAGPIEICNDGNTKAFGDPNYNSGTGTSSGYVHIQEYSNTGWNNLAVFYGNNAGGYTGRSIALNSSGTKVVVGSSGDYGTGIDNGSVSVYDLTNINNLIPTQIGQTISSTNDNDFFGWSVDINHSGNRIIIGAPNRPNNATNSGYVEIYELNGSNWTQVGQTLYPGTTQFIAYGAEVSINSTGDKILAYSNNYNNNLGLIKLYEYNGNNWVQLGTDFIGTATENISRVKLNSDGSKIIIGYNSFVKVFEWNNNSWTQVGQTINDLNTSNGFGDYVSINGPGDLIAVSSSNASFLPGQTPYGCVTFYYFDGINWIQKGESIFRDSFNPATSQTSCFNVFNQISSLGSKLTQISAQNTIGLHQPIWGVFTSYPICQEVIYDTISSCGDYTWVDGNTYSSSGDYAYLKPTSFCPCDTIHKLNLTINPTNFNYINVPFCGNSFTINGQTYNSIGYYTDTLFSANSLGCDSVIYINLYDSPSTGNDNLTVCGEFSHNGVNYNGNSTIQGYDTLINYLGCDSIIDLNLTVSSDSFDLDFSVDNQGFTTPPFIPFFTNLSANMQLFDYTWDWGDGTQTQSNNVNVFHEYLYNGLFDVKLIAERISTGCIDTLSEQDYIFTSGGSGLSIIKKIKSVNIYPNPTNENITISIINYNGNIQTEVFDLIGNRLQVTNETTISLREYARGIYILKVAYADKVEEVKVIKD